jgi:hypothetical protein
MVSNMRAQQLRESNHTTSAQMQRDKPLSHSLNINFDDNDDGKEIKSF